MIRVLKKAAFLFVRIFLVTFIFIADVKVRAEAVIRSTSGPVEVEKNGALKPVTDQAKVIEPFEVQTFQSGAVKMAVNSIFMGLGERTLVNVADAPRFDMSWGTAFFDFPLRTSNWVSIRTPQVDLSTQGGEMLISVRGGKTRISVLSGRAELIDRSSRTSQVVRAGYQAWVGGLLADGTHAKGRPGALDFEVAMTWLRVLSGESQSEWQSRYDRLKPAWKQAVAEVAQETQDQVLSDLQFFHDYQETEQKKQARQDQEQKQRRAMFRRKTMGDPAWLTSPASPSLRAQDGPSGVRTVPVDAGRAGVKAAVPAEPDENTEAPSESNRVPANSGE